MHARPGIAVAFEAGLEVGVGFVVNAVAVDDQERCRAALSIRRERAAGVPGPPKAASAGRTRLAPFFQPPESRDLRSDAAARPGVYPKNPKTCNRVTV